MTLKYKTIRRIEETILDRVGKMGVFMGLPNTGNKSKNK